MTNGIKKLPYGVSDFVSVREENLYYVDKTMYLPELEDQAHTLIYIHYCPRKKLTIRYNALYIKSF